MPAGRPSKRQILPDTGDGTWRELIVLGSDDRIRMSADIARRRPWLAPGNEVLAALKPECTIVLEPYSDNARAINDRLRAAADDQSTDLEQLEFAIRSRYIRLRVNSDGRMPVPKDFRLCLGLSPLEPEFIAIIVRPETVTIEPGRLSDYEYAEEVLVALELP